MVDKLKGRARPDEGQAARAYGQAQRTGGQVPDHGRPVTGARRPQVPGRWRPDIGHRPVRGTYPPLGSHRPRPAGNRRSSLDAQFATLEDLGEQTEVEARLAALKFMDPKAIDY